MKATIFIIKKVLRFCYRYVIALAFVFLLSSFITLGVNILNKTTVNILINDIRNNHLSITFIFSLAGYLVIWLLSSFIGYIEAFANNIFRLKVDVFMQKLFMKKINETDQELFLIHPSWKNIHLSTIIQIEQVYLFSKYLLLYSVI